MAETPIADHFRAAASRFRAGASTAPDRQRAILELIVAENRDTAFGKDHGFASIRDEAEYRQRVPMRDYGGLAPWIDRAAAGEHAVLTSSPPLAFFRTSGTTRAPKLIPQTRPHFDDHVSTMDAFWGAMMAHYPALAEGPGRLARLIGSVSRGELTAGGIPVCSSLSFFEQPPDPLPAVIKMWPYIKIPQEYSTYESALRYRFRELVEWPVAVFTAVNPSTVVRFFALAGGILPDVIRELHDGLKHGNPAERNRQRAAELERALDRRNGDVCASDIWPGLRAVFCWKSSGARRYVDRLRTLSGDGVDVTEFPCVASEGSFTITFERNSVGGYVAYPHQYFEWVPMGSDRAVGLRDLERGKRYSVVVTNRGGLYRYKMGDVYEVLDIPPNGLPVIGFMGREGIVSSFTGEKLYEAQVSAAAEGAFRALGMESGLYVCCATWAETPYYSLVIGRAATATEIVSLSEEFERRLANENEEYESKRASGRLGRARVVCVDEARLEASLRAGLKGDFEGAFQRKERVLIVDDAIVRTILSMVGAGSGSPISSNAPALGIN
jgi:hypothetical protein